MIKRIEDLFLTLKGIYLYEFKIKNTPYSNSKSHEIYKYNQLRKLLIESSKNVPYYKKLFSDIGFNPEKDFNKLEDLNKIPILDKKVVRENPKLFYNSRIKKNLILHTSGSSGNPLKVKISLGAWAVEQAVVWRHWKWAGYNFRDKMAIVRSYVPKEGKLIKKDKIRNFIYYSPFHLNDKNSEMYLNHMSSEKVKFLRGYPSSIKTLANFIINNNFTPPTLKSILVASERLSEQDKKTIEKAFSCTVYNHYGLADICVMMGSCEEGKGLHNYEDYGHLELLDFENRDCIIDSDIKKIIGTNLHNLAMPLIRYNTDDLAEISKENCSCPRTFPVIKNILGRNDAEIRTKEKYTIPTVNFYTLFEYYIEIEQWQIVQKSLDKVVVNIKVKESESFIEKKLREDFKSRLPDSIEIKIRINKGFLKKNEGKIPTFVSEL
tara:strand:+ start:144684 stop:145988 length:1305 start_codon:yes stop_codon:yes gene_type:complete